MKRATLFRLVVAFAFVAPEAVLRHRLVGFLRIDAGIVLLALLRIVALRRPGRALVLGQLVLIDLAVPVALQLVHSAFVPANVRERLPTARSVTHPI